MKALDTSVLLALLEGSRPARALVTHLRGVELATTEVNLLELAYLAARGPPRSRTARRGTLDRLRRKITVLPIDSRAGEQAARALSKGSAKTPASVLAMLSALEANGCDELFTQDGGLEPGNWSFKITRFVDRDAK